MKSGVIDRKRELTGWNDGVIWRRVDADGGHGDCYGAYSLGASDIWSAIVTWKVWEISLRGCF